MNDVSVFSQTTHEEIAVLDGDSPYYLVAGDHLVIDGVTYEVVRATSEAVASPDNVTAYSHYLGTYYYTVKEAF